MYSTLPFDNPIWLQDSDTQYFFITSIPFSINSLSNPRISEFHSNPTYRNSRWYLEIILFTIDQFKQRSLFNIDIISSIQYDLLGIQIVFHSVTLQSISSDLHSHYSIRNQYRSILLIHNTSWMKENSQFHFSLWLITHLSDRELR